MAQTTVGIRELKEKLGSYMRQVKAGKTLIITEHGKPVGRIMPINASARDKMQAMIDAGIIEWNGRKPKPFKPTIRLRGTRTLSDIILENRD